MKGNPALRTILVLLLLTAVAYPVFQVISHGAHRGSDPVTSLPSVTTPSDLTGTLRIRTAPKPIHLKVTAGEKVLLETKESDERAELTRDLSLPPGSELLVRVEWADDRPHALHAEFLPRGTNAPVSRDYWSGRTLEDVLSLP